MLKQHTQGPVVSESQMSRLMAYVADLELEVDRLRRLGHLVHLEAWTAVDRIQRLWEDAAVTGAAPPLVPEVVAAVKDLAGLLSDVREPAGYHPIHDQVVAVAVRPLAEQVFRSQQRLVGAMGVTLRLDLESEYVEWFPARLRHIIDNLVSNALKYNDPSKSQAWVQVALRVSPTSYELRVSDNGLGLPPGGERQAFELFYRAGAARPSGPGVGLSVVNILVEKSGGTLTVDSGEGQGTTFVAVLPRYDVDDFLL